ncbi:MAG: hypothetical protein JW785_12105 [Acidimicrobiia bacterium]|nr:hypothetical protein [Acidimicrobiia bacterium]
MRSSRLALLAVAGLAAGAAAAFLLLPGAAGPAAGSATTTAPTTTTVAPWIGRHETRIGPTVLVPLSLETEGDRLLFTYDLFPITPLAEASPEARGSAAGAVPASFTLTYPGGVVSYRVLGPTQRAARFEVPAGVSPDQVQAINIDSYWLPVPGGYAIELSPSSGAWVPAAPGVRARILQVLEQAANYLVVVELEADAILTEHLAIAGEGRDWQSSSYSQIGGQRWTLDFRGETLPDPVRLTVRGLAWIEVPGGGPVDLDGMAR